MKQGKAFLLHSRLHVCQPDVWQPNTVIQIQRHTADETWFLKCFIFMFKQLKSEQWNKTNQEEKFISRGPTA